MEHTFAIATSMFLLGSHCISYHSLLLIWMIKSLLLQWYFLHKSEEEQLCKLQRIQINSSVTTVEGPHVSRKKNATSKKYFLLRFFPFSPQDAQTMGHLWSPLTFKDKPTWLTCPKWWEKSWPQSREDLFDRKIHFIHYLKFSLQMCNFQH